MDLVLFYYESGNYVYDYMDKLFDKYYNYINDYVIFCDIFYLESFLFVLNNLNIFLDLFFFYLVRNLLGRFLYIDCNYYISC